MKTQALVAVVVLPMDMARSRAEFSALRWAPRLVEFPTPRSGFSGAIYRICRIAVTLLTNIDNANNGLPDWWEEQHGLDLFAANANVDLERDGMSNLLEYAFGANPGVPDFRERGPQAGQVTVTGQALFAIGFYRRQGDGSLVYRVQESPDLTLWSDLNLSQQTIGTPQDMGDGTEFVTVRGTIPTFGQGTEPRGFMRVVVERP